MASNDLSQLQRISTWTDIGKRTTQRVLIKLTDPCYHGLLFAPFCISE